MSNALEAYNHQYISSWIKLQEYHWSPQALEQNLNSLERTVQNHDISGTALPQNKKQGWKNYNKSDHFKNLKCLPTQII